MTLSKTVDVLDTGAGTFFLRSDVVGPFLNDRIMSAALPAFCDANHSLLNMKGTDKLSIQLGLFLITLLTFLCVKNAHSAPY